MEIDQAYFKNTQKQALNLSVKAGTVMLARELGMNLSQTVDVLLEQEVKRRYWEKWREDNREAFEAYNQRIRKEGLPLAKYRSFGQSLGDGREES